MFKKNKQRFRKSVCFYARIEGSGGRGQSKCDFTRAETRFHFLAKRTSPFKSAGASVQSATGSRGVRISGSNAWYTMFRGSVKGTGFPIHSPVSPSLPPPVRHRVPPHFIWSLPTHLDLLFCAQRLRIARYNWPIWGGASWSFHLRTETSPSRTIVLISLLSLLFCVFGISIDGQSPDAKY